jgi:hypothetical protein
MLTWRMMNPDLYNFARPDRPVRPPVMSDDTAGIISMLIVAAFGGFVVWSAMHGYGPGPVPRNLGETLLLLGIYGIPVIVSWLMLLGYGVLLVYRLVLRVMKLFRTRQT